MMSDDKMKYIMVETKDNGSGTGLSDLQVKLNKESEINDSRLVGYSAVVFPNPSTGMPEIRHFAIMSWFDDR